MLRGLQTISKASVLFSKHLSWGLNVGKLFTFIWITFKTVPAVQPNCISKEKARSEALEVGQYTVYDSEKRH